MLPNASERMGRLREIILATYELCMHIGYVLTFERKLIRYYLSLDIAFLSIFGSDGADVYFKVEKQKHLVQLDRL